MEITAAMVKELRSQTGSGIMECKSALKEANGNVEDAITFLRKKGLAKAEKKADRQTADGKIGSYIHPGDKIGVMLQLNCETDFVANTPDFQGLARDIAMHIAATKPRFATREEVTEEILEKEREIFVHQAKESGKPENIIEKIVVGKMEKFYEENCVLEQAFIKDTSVTISELIKQKIALLGENINLGKFVRFEI
jgi:elongation factor Ts